MSEALLLRERIETIERGYEFLLAYAAQGRIDDSGTDVFLIEQALKTAPRPG